MKSKQYLYNIFHIHSSQFLILMAQKSEEIMPDPDAITRLRRDRLLGANLTGCDVNFCWMIQMQKKQSDPRRPCTNYRIHCFCMNVFDLRGAWTQEGNVFVYATNGRRVELRGNFQTPIFAFTEEKHTFLKRLMERRTTKEYSTVLTRQFELRIW